MFFQKVLKGIAGKPAMKSIQLTENQISAVENYLLGTALSIGAALHACYVDGEEDGYFADELDSVSKSCLEGRIFRCAVCSVWSKMFEHARRSIRIGCTPACEICTMSPEDILDSDSHFLVACGIRGDVLTGTDNLLRSPDIAGSARPTDRLQVTDADLDFLSACGIRVRLTPKDIARRKLVMQERKHRGTG